MSIHEQDTGRAELEKLRPLPGLSIRSGWDVALTVLWLAVCLAIVAMAGLSRLSESAVGRELPNSISNGFLQGFPQGWSFFTKDPRSEQVQGYTREAPGRWKTIDHGHNNGVGSAFGISRKTRTHGLELAFMTKALDQNLTKLTECRSREALDCLEAAAATPVATVRNPSPNPIYCGTVGLVMYKPTSFEWRDFPTGNAKVKVVTVRSECEGER
ncbi:SdpA family antimicrobial peptide system protein [Micromonospora trifolii]|uniref:SdpA family antimicrobial peptide system protein n=1 Tax=Micromonospora trifolii TaxID=2911208 RepID=UPI003CF83A9C